jgi:hypothetical protein
MYAFRAAALHNFRWLYLLTLAIALLMAGVSLAGLLFPAAVYPSGDLRQALVSNDVVNLFIGLPILLGSLAGVRRGRLLGLLFWPGALFYVTYNSFAYAVALPPALPFGVHAALVGMSLVAIAGLLASIDPAAVQQRLGGAVPERLSGGVLAAFGLLFFGWRAALVAQALSGAAPLPGPELATAVADLLITPAWVAGGVLLWRRQAPGYVCGVGLLFQASMLFAGLLVFFLLQPLLAGVPFPAEDCAVIFAMGLFCFVPFGLFVRGAAARA